MTLLAIDWSSILVKTGQFILAFSILVVLHEMGHFLPARWFKCRVEKFYLFFNPWFSIFKKKIGETEYGIGWVPFGGYVKISGMIDESMDKEQLKLPPKDYEFRAKKPWQRLIIMLGGVIVNIILAIVIFVGIMWHYGETYVPIENLKYGVHADSLGVKMGLQEGDRIVAVGNKKIERAGTVGGEIILQQASQITVSRDEQQIVLDIPKGFKQQLNSNKGVGFSRVRFPIIIDSVLAKAKITNGTLQKNDVVIAVDDSAVQFVHQLDFLDKVKSKNVTFKVLRNAKDTLTAQVYFDEKGNNNIGLRNYGKILGETHIDYSLSQAIPAGWNKCWQTLDKYVSNLKLLFKKNEVKVNDSLGGIFSIANTFGGTWDWEAFWTLTAVFSIILAFMNVLPIPALDGGHALFTIYEMITGRKPSDKFMEYAQTVGMFLLLGLMVYALGLDVFRWFK
ncbi:MAG: RIP metalloprotease RseP [Bacteroidetes bacterium]|nr:RIP metalloprotease RseP [Bacteroidota bacterium]